MLLTGWAPLPLLTGCAVVVGSASALLLPTLTSVVPQIVARTDLQPANALLRLGANTANISGLALAGVAVALLGPGVALAVNSATYVIAAALLAGLGTTPPRPTPATPRRVLAGLRDGFAEFTSRQWLWVTVVSAAFLNAATMAAFGVLGPVLANERLGGAIPWSMIMAGYTAGC